MFGCCRFVFNHFLQKWNEVYVETGTGLSYNSCATQLPFLKQSFTWLKKADSIALQSTVQNVADSFVRFSREQNNKPRFKSRKNPIQSYTTKYTSGNIEIRDRQVKLPKLGWVRFVNSRLIQGRILTATIRKNAAGKFFVSILCKEEMTSLPQSNNTIGIDVGIKEFAVCSNGRRISNPKFLRKYEKQMALWQRRMSRRKNS